MKFLKVNLWGKEIGRLVWESSTRRIYFMFNPELPEIPDIAPLLTSSQSKNLLLPVFGDDRPLYQGLPPFIADSLPDSWGNVLFERWVKENKIPRNKVTPLYKLMFIGKRGIGALEYEPYAEELNHTHAINVKSLYDMSLSVLKDRDRQILNANDALTLQGLLAVGTSAGGRQMKAIIAINGETGEIKSGQTDYLEGFEYYILKFGDASMPVAEIETAFYNMAVAAGIVMEKSCTLQVDGINHFLTKRFDRVNGKKIHVQTLAAMNPEARSYEDLIATCRELCIPETDIEQVFCRMVFNVIANNTDDHNKNFSFLLEENGKWRLSPAYDITFIFNVNGTGPNVERRLSIGGKTREISQDDLLNFARQNGIKNAAVKVKKIANAVKNFNSYADDAGITQPWLSIIQKTLNDNLKEFGYLENEDSVDTSFKDSFARIIENVCVSVNSKGCFEISLIINGKRRRKFISPKSPFFHQIMEKDFLNLSVKEKIHLIESLFPAE